MKNEDKIQISIAKDFSIYPGARYRTDGNFSGQQFYEEILKPKLKQVWDKDNQLLFIDLDGTFKYASSFISEIFLRTVKDFKDKDKIKKKMEFKSEDAPLLINAIWQIIDEAEAS